MQYLSGNMLPPSRGGTQQMDIDQSLTSLADIKYAMILFNM